MLRRIVRKVGAEWKWGPGVRGQELVNKVAVLPISRVLGGGWCIRERGF